MNNRLMIRLIDVALLILLGFIAISRLKTEYVALPSGSASESPQQQPHETFLHIYPTSFDFVDQGRRWQCLTLDDLEHTLVDYHERYAQRRIKMILTIEPHKSSIMQTLVDVLDLCQRNQIEKNLNYADVN